MRPWRGSAGSAGQEPARRVRYHPSLPVEVPAMIKKSTRSKLSLHRETLRALETKGAGIGGNTSCIQSCYDMSCEGGCGLSDGATTA